MTRKELRKTAWAKRFKKGVAESYVYDEAIRLAMKPGLEVLVYKSTALETPVWAISVQETNSRPDDNFWMDAFKLKKDALALCKEMGWRVVE